MLSIPLLVVLGVRRDGQKVLLAVKNMGGETEAAWRHVLEDLLGRGLKAPELLIVDGGKGLEAALASLWNDIPVQRCTVHKERNLLAHAPKELHDEVKSANALSGTTTSRGSACVFIPPGAGSISSRPAIAAG